MAEYLVDDSGIGISTPIGVGGATFVLNKLLFIQEQILMKKMHMYFQSFQSVELKGHGLNLLMHQTLITLELRFVQFITRDNYVLYAMGI
jgi:2-phospho-L-lactate transferase/gluconeogenesis factor (CofD/UPF0052 family)